MEYTAVIEVEEAKLKTFEDMLNWKKEDLIKNDMPTLDTIKTWTAHFADGCFADVKVNTSEDDVWTEAVLFEGCGYELAHTEVCDNIRGEWEFEVDGDTYKVEVKAA